MRFFTAVATLIAIVALVAATPALGAVAINGTPTTNVSSSGRSGATFSHTVLAGSDRLLVVMVHFEDDDGGDDISVSSITYAGFDLVPAVVQDGSSATHTELWYLINPPVGTASIVATYGSADSEADGIAVLNYTGVNQVSAIGATAGNTATSGTNATVDITTTTANSLIVGGFTGSGGDTQPAASGTGTNERYDTQTGDNADDIGLVGGDESSASPGLFTFNWTMGASDDWTIVAAEIRPVPPPSEIQNEVCNADIVLMLDRTGSMTSADLTLERIAAKAVLATFDDALVPPYIGIGAFGDNTNGSPEAFIEHALTASLVPAPYGEDDTGNDSDNDLYDAIENVTASNSAVGSNLSDALSIANAQLTSNGVTSNRVIVLISDGEASEPTNVDTATEAALDTADAIKLAGREIFTIHFGTDPDGFTGKDLMAALATGTFAVGSHNAHTAPAHQTGSDNQVTAAAENTDEDHFFVAPTAADMESILQEIATQFCQSLPTPTPTSTPTITPTNTPTNTPTRTPTRTPTTTPTNTFTSTPTNTPTRTPTSTNTPTSTPTATHSNTATNTPSNTPTRTPTSTNTPTSTPTNTATATHTNTATNTPSNTPTRTPTSTNTPTSTPTNTATATHANTATLTPTATNTPTATHTNTLTSTPTDTPTWTPTSTNTPTATPTPTPTDTSTSTPTDTSTSTPTHTPTVTPTSTDTSTPTSTPTDTPTETPTDTPTPTSTDTPTDTPTQTPIDTPTDTPTSTPTETATITPTETATSTPVDTSTQTPTQTATNTSTNTPTVTPTRTSTNTVTPTPTPTPTVTPTATATPICPLLPKAGCFQADTARPLRLSNKNGKTKLIWKWRISPGGVQNSDFGDPLTTSSYALCIFADNPQTLVAEYTAVANGVCGGKPCWKKVRKGYRHKNKTAAGHELRKLTLLARNGPLADVKALGKGKGGSFFVPPMPFPEETVTVQLVVSDTTECWQSFFTPPFKKNTATKFKDKSDP